MSGKEVIVILAITLSGCSSMKKTMTNLPVKSSDDRLALTERTTNRNLTARDFNIVKAEVEILNNGESQKLVATVKYRKPGNYLVTIRNRTGIEAARVYITHDTVLINDRIYRKLYCGSNEYLLKKYGVATNSLPLIFGDYLSDLTEVEILKDCTNGTSEIQGYLETKELWYYIDCKEAKVSAVTISEKTGTAGMNMKFGDFRSEGNIIYPAQIMVEDILEKTQISIKIGSVDLTDSRPLEFIPGKNYERIILK
jgi:hypothetical protein